MRTILTVLAAVAALVASPCAAQPATTLTPARPVAASGAAPPAPGPRAAPLTRADLETWLDGFLPFSLRRGDVAGAVVVVVKDGQVLLQKGYGYADIARKTPIDPERTLMRPGSVSKLFTWTALMQLVEAGRVGLDQDVNTYLDFKVPPFHGKPVTVRNLMTHTPGFDEASKEVVAFGSSVPPLEAFLKRAMPARVYPPGEVPAYSNYGAALAGLIIERVSGQTFDDYIDGHIMRPLDMRRSSFRQPLPAALRPDMAKAYITASAAPKPFEMVALAPAGSLSATGSDMGRFMLAHLADGRLGEASILRPETARLMHTIRYPAISPNLDSMLLGFYQINRNGHRIIGHMGDTEAFHSYLWLYPDDNVGVFVSFDGLGRDAAVGPIRGALFDEFADRYFSAPPPAATHVDLATARRDGALLAGRYDVSRRSQSSFFSLINLLGQATLSVDAQGLLRASPLRDDAGKLKAFQEVAPMLWREVGGQERLAAKVVGGKVVLWGEDSFSPFESFMPTPAWRDAGWLLPLLVASIVAALTTLALWPVTAWARRRYGGVFTLAGAEAVSYRMVRIVVGGAGVTMALWLQGLVGLLKSGDLSSAADPWLETLHIFATLLFPAALAAAVWNVWVVWRSRHGWRSTFARLWSGVLLISAGTILWTGLVFHLLGFGLRY